MADTEKKSDSLKRYVGLVIGGAALVIACVASAFLAIGAAFVQGSKSMDIDPAVVQKHADKIVDPNVGVGELETLGFYKQNFGGIFVDGCRKEVLTDSFNQGLSTLAKAEQISNCVKREVISLNARTIAIRRYN